MNIGDKVWLLDGNDEVTSGEILEIYPNTREVLVRVAGDPTWRRVFKFEFIYYAEKEALESLIAEFEYDVQMYRNLAKDMAHKLQGLKARYKKLETASPAC